MDIAKSAKYWTIGALGLLCVCPSAVWAQSKSNAKPATDSLLDHNQISSFVTEFGVPIIVGDHALPAVDYTDGDRSVRIARLTSMTSHVGATWRKIYRITPATANDPVTTPEQAERMVDNSAPVNLSVDSAPTISIERLVAHSDGADASFPDGIPQGDISINLSGADTADAIAAVAAQTHTHWMAAYYVAPAETPTYSSSQIASARVGTASVNPAGFQSQYEPQYFNGPIIIHVATPPPAPAATTPTTPDVNTAPVKPGAAAGTPTTSAPAPNVAAPMVPAIVQDPYGYNGLMYAPSYGFSSGGQVLNPFGQ